MTKPNRVVLMCTGFFIAAATCLFSVLSNSCWSAVAGFVMALSFGIAIEVETWRVN